MSRFRTVALSAAAFLIFSCAAFAQVSSLEGDVKGEDGTPVKGALVTSCDSPVSLARFTPSELSPVPVFAVIFQVVVGAAPDPPPGRRG